MILKPINKAQIRPNYWEMVKTRESWEELKKKLGFGKRDRGKWLRKQTVMGSTPAQIPTSFGHELRACLRCRLVKTYDQVFLYSFTVSSIRVLVFLSFIRFLGVWFAFISLFKQFRDAGCENCPFFKMEEDHERIVEVTTPNFNGYIMNSKPLLYFSSVLSR